MKHSVHTLRPLRNLGLGLALLSLWGCQVPTNDDTAEPDPCACSGAGGQPAATVDPTGAGGAAGAGEPDEAAPLDLDTPGEPTEPDETAPHHAPVAIAGAPVELHSQTRKDCQYVRVSRYSEVHPEIRLGGLDATSFDAEHAKLETVESFRKEIIESLTKSASAELLAGFQKDTGMLPGSFNVQVGGKVEKSVAEQMADAWAAVRTQTVITYKYTVTGSIEARLVAKVIDVYDWYGEDCDMPSDLTQHSYTAHGPWQTLKIVPLVYTIYEVTLPTQERGESWADERMKQELHRTLQRAWESGPLRSLPSPL